MSYILGVIVIVLIIGGLWRLSLAVRAGGPTDRGAPRDDSDVTSRATKPPAHPDRPIPGSDRARGDR